MSSLCPFVARLSKVIPPHSQNELGFPGLVALATATQLSDTSPPHVSRPIRRRRIHRRRWFRFFVVDGVARGLHPTQGRRRPCGTPPPQSPLEDVRFAGQGRALLPQWEGLGGHRPRLVHARPQGVRRFPGRDSSMPIAVQ